MFIVADEVSLGSQKAVGAILMDHLLPEYEVRFLDLTTLRVMFMQAVQENRSDPDVSKMLTMGEAEQVFGWLVEDAVCRLLSCRVDRHYYYDLGAYLADRIPLFEKQVKQMLGPIKIAERGLRVKRVKMMTLGSLLMFAFIA